MDKTEKEPDARRAADRFLRLKINYLVGRYLYRARLRAMVSRDRAARKICISEADLRLIERGSLNIPLCDLAKLAELYGMMGTEAAYFTLEIPLEASRPWGMHEFAAIAMHRFCVDYDISTPVLGQKVLAPGI